VNSLVFRRLFSNKTNNHDNSSEESDELPPSSKYHITSMETCRGDSIYMAGVMVQNGKPNSKRGREVRNLMRQVKPTSLVVCVEVPENLLKDTTDEENLQKVGNGLVTSIINGPETELAAALSEAKRLNSAIDISLVDGTDTQKKLLPLLGEFIRMCYLFIKGVARGSPPFVTSNRDILTKEIEEFTRVCPRLMEIMINYRCKKLFTSLQAHLRPPSSQSDPPADNKQRVVVVLAPMPCMDMLEAMVMDHYRAA